MNRVQNGILPASSTRLDSANISSANARPLKIRPRPNLRGIDGLALPSLIQIQAMTGARVMIATEFTDWNQAVGNVQSPKPRSTMLSARKVNELPACSKNIQNSTLKAKMISIATTLSRCTLPSRMPSTSSSRHSTANIAPRIQASIVAPDASRKNATGIATIAPMNTHSTFSMLSLPAGAMPMPISCLRPNQNHTRLTSMPMPEAMNTTLYDGIASVPNTLLAR